MRSIKESAQSLVIKKAFAFIEANPEVNLGKIAEWLHKVDTQGNIKEELRVLDGIVANKDGNWFRYIKKFFNEINPLSKAKLIENLVINGTANWKPIREALSAKHNCNIPWAILMDPTSACNLHCTGCWASEYGNKLNLSEKEWDSIITQGKDMGIHVFIYSGGEPLVRRKEIIQMCEKYDDCIFLAFTNGTLINEYFADEMLRVGNFIPAISIEGNEAETDARRGKGCYAAVTKSMAILKERQLPFGVSCCYTKDNTETIGSEQYIDDLIERGAFFAWFFTYMPVGVNAVTDLMVTPAQREYMYHQLREFRKTKSLFTLDFWNDGEYVRGCIAGGRYYLHINANGDIEPCAFIHYSDSNIRHKTILEACKSPLFMQYRSNQPFNENLLRPCPLLDNPECLEGMVKRSNAKSTDMESPEDVHKLCAKCAKAASNWMPVADRLYTTHIYEKILCEM